MTNKQIHYTLVEIAEEVVPSAEIDLWRHLVTSESRLKTGDVPMKPNFAPRRMTALAVLSVAAALIVLFISPQGRAFAQTILQFFTRAQSDTLPLQSENSPTEPPRNQSILDAQNLAGFEVLTPTALPDGLNFYGASYDGTLKAIVQQFGYTPAEVRLSIRQQPITTPEVCTLCGLVGASAPVKPVDIGTVRGEYLEGVWELTDNGPVWRNDPYIKTLRWQKDGMAYEMIYMGTELDENALVSISTSMK